MGIALVSLVVVVLFYL